MSSDYKWYFSLRKCKKEGFLYKLSDGHDEKNSLAKTSLLCLTLPGHGKFQVMDKFTFRKTALSMDYFC